MSSGREKGEGREEEEEAEDSQAGIDSPDGQSIYDRGKGLCSGGRSTKTTKRSGRDRTGMGTNGGKGKGARRGCLLPLPTSSSDSGGPGWRGRCQPTASSQDEQEHCRTATGFPLALNPDQSDSSVITIRTNLRTPVYIRVLRS